MQILRVFCLGVACLLSPSLVRGQGHVLDKPVPELCLNCICDALSGCNATLICTSPKNVTCGVFYITLGYWMDGGNSTINGDQPDSEEAFIHCANDRHCAANSVQNYVKKFKQDCNGDGRIDCYDFAAIHKLGGYGCKGDISYKYQSAIDKCLTSSSTFEVRTSGSWTTYDII